MLQPLVLREAVAVHLGERLLVGLADEVRHQPPLVVGADVAAARILGLHANRHDEPCALLAPRGRMLVADFTELDQLAVDFATAEAAVLADVGLHTRAAQGRDRSILLQLEHVWNRDLPVTARLRASK